MRYLLLSGLGVTLVILGIQDFKDRRISIYLLLLTLLLCTSYYVLINSFSSLPKRFIVNAAFTSLILVSGTLLVRIRRPKQAIVSFIGAGDFLFLLAISPMFSFESYLVFLNTSIILILIVYGVYLISNQNRRSYPIPFAGALSACLFILLAINEFIYIDLTNLTFNLLQF